MPVDHQLWDTKDIAQYLRRERRVVTEQVTCLPSFPKPIRLPTGDRSRKLWRAAEIIQWALSYQEK